MSELDEHAQMLHGLGGPSSWARTIDSMHEAAGFERPGASPDVPAVLARIRAAWSRVEEVRVTASPGKRVRRVLRAIESGDVGDRDAAIILVGAVGAMRYTDIAQATTESMSFVPGDGVWFSLRDGEDAWVASVDAPGLCAPCALVRWLRSSTGHVAMTRGASRVAPSARHACASRLDALELAPERRPLFTTLEPDVIVRRSLTPDEIRSVISERFSEVGVEAAGTDGARDELVIARVINEIWVG